jgi:probable HAF family extracellular repeat protein
VLWDQGTVRDLGRLPFPLDVSAVAYDINDVGAVAGTSYGTPYLDGRRIVTPSHAFVWQRGRMTDLGTLGGDNSAALAINERGQVTGWSETGEVGPGPKGPVPVVHPFVWDHGVMSDLGTLGATFSQGTDINNSGQVVGASSSAESCCSFLWQHDSMTPFSGLNPGDQTEAQAINDREDVVGSDDSVSPGPRPVLWQRGTAIDLTTAGPCPGFVGFAGVDINNRGDIVGNGPELRDVGQYRGNYQTAQICRDGGHSFLPAVGPLSGDNIAVRMNLRDEVVGVADLLTSDGSAFLAEHAAWWRPVQAGDR